MNLYKDEDLD